MIRKRVSITPEVAKRIKARREELGLSQWDAGMAANITGTQWSRLERGASGTKWSTFCSIAGALRTSPESLLGSQDGDPGGAADGSVSAELHEEVSKLDAGRQRKLLQLVRALQQNSIDRCAA